MDASGEIWSTVPRGSGGEDEHQLSSHLDVAMVRSHIRRLASSGLTVWRSLRGPKNEPDPRSGLGRRSRPGKRW